MVTSRDKVYTLEEDHHHHEDDDEFFRRATVTPVEGMKNDLFPLPDWVNPAKVDAGKRFVRDNFFAVFFAHLISLLFLLSYAPVRNVLVLTGKSDTKLKSLRRYLTTLVHIKSWYEHDVLTASGNGARDIVKIRKTHACIAESIAKQLPTASKESSGVQSTLTNNSRKEIMQEKRITAVKKDGASGFTRIRSEDSTQVIISQLDMLVTQFCFVGFIATYPRQFGIVDDDYSEALEGFIHLWAVIGHLLGIQEQFNICLQTVQHRRRAVLNKILMPEFLNCSSKTVNLWECLLEGVSSFIPFISLRGLLLFVWKHLKCKAPDSVLAECSSYDRLCYSLMWSCFREWLYFHPLRQLFNALLRLAIYSSYFLHIRCQATSLKISASIRLPLRFVKHLLETAQTIASSFNKFQASSGGDAPKKKTEPL